MLDVFVIQGRGRTHAHPPGFIVVAAPGEWRCLVIEPSLGSGFVIVKSQKLRFGIGYSNSVSIADQPLMVPRFFA
ncbi:hypothetical protein D3C80_1214670 [compost metagenome]